MREVEVSRFVQAPPAAVEPLLSPIGLMDAEGSFEVRNVSDTDGGTEVTVGGYGLELVFRFTEREDGIAYEQVSGPLDVLETTVTCAPENEGTRLTARSRVAVGGPELIDRLAAWKRRGELRRALRAVADAA
ncbi:SRPBCC family protein [Salinirubellus sp. GCM10025818]|uniref:SRPBCC family protein n=1 Tax=Salinirubellus TaxID=2162630 RepID=UPI0030CEA510